jgi:dipicolinate synthase subunit A
MNHPYYDFAIVGGDMRQIYMTNELIARDFSVIVYGLKDPLLNLNCYHAESLTEIINSCRIIITPIPISKDGFNIIALEPKLDLTIDNLCSLLTPKHRLYGGCFTTALINKCEANHIFHYDFMENEEVILYNTIATAEGAMAEAIYNSTINLHGSSCLIIGYGKCARTLADKLKGLCNHIDIAARSPRALADAYAESFGTTQITKLKDKIHQYDYIFNTVPALILTKELLS